MFSMPARIPNDKEVTSKAKQLATKSFRVESSEGSEGSEGSDNTAVDSEVGFAGMAIGLVILATVTYLSNVHNAT